MDNIKVELDVPDFVKFIEYLKDEIEKKAHMAANDAGYGGRHDDGGAVYMRNEISIYAMALNKEIPSKWKPYLVEFTFKNNLDKDPEYRDEYAEFLRLRDKFKEIPDERV
jgi:hypothetical protein